MKTVKQLNVDLRAMTQKAWEEETKAKQFQERTCGVKSDKIEIQRLRSQLGEVESRAAKLEREKNEIERLGLCLYFFVVIN